MKLLLSNINKIGYLKKKTHKKWRKYHQQCKESVHLLFPFPLAMANGSIESKGESNVWPADDSAQTQPSSRHHQDPGTPGDLNDNPHAASHFPPHPRPPSPVSVAELQERAVQDSQNNNVDENSNDHHYDQYAAAAVYPNWEASFQSEYSNQQPSLPPPYLTQETSHPSYSSREASSYLNWETSSQQSRGVSQTHSSQEDRPFHPNRETMHPPNLAQDAHHLYSSHCRQDVSYPNHPSHSRWEAASHPDQSVRPRVRQPPHHYRDEADCTPLPQQPLSTRRDSDGSSINWHHGGLKHRRNQSEGTTRYPLLPNLNRPSDGSGETSVLLHFILLQ